MKTIFMGRCNHCSNCSTINRWNAMYEVYLKDNPKQTKWIQDMQEMDNKALPCFNFNLDKALKDQENLKGEVDELSGDTIEAYQ